MKRLLIALGCLLTFVGCGGSSTRQPAGARPKQKGVQIYASKIPAYNEAVRKGDRAEALRLIREEIQRPSIEGDDEYLAQTRVIGISALTVFTTATGPSAEADADAKRYYDEGLRFAGRNP